MNSWIVFSGPACPWCVKAKDLLKAKGIEFEEVVIDSREKMAVMQEYAPGFRTIPVIIHNGKLVGGFDALVKYLAA